MEEITKFITVREASKLTGYNPDYLSSLIRSGKISGQKVGRGWVTTKENVENYFKQQPTPSAIVFYFQTFKLGTLTIIVAFAIALLLTGIYITIYETAYQQAEVHTATAATASDDAPIKY